AGETPANGIAKWNGTSWSSLGQGIGTGGGSEVFAIAVWGNDVYAGGFYYDQGTYIAVVAKWNGTWSVLGSSPGNSVIFGTIAVSGQDVYVGGHFTSVGGVPAANIAKWDGSHWSALGSGISGDSGYVSVYDLTVSGTDIYAGGSFTTAGGAAVSNIAKWNGSTWSALGSGV